MDDKVFESLAFALTRGKTSQGWAMLSDGDQPLDRWSQAASKADCHELHVNTYSGQLQATTDQWLPAVGPTWTDIPHYKTSSLMAALHPAAWKYRADALKSLPSKVRRNFVPAMQNLFGASIAPALDTCSLYNCPDYACMVAKYVRHVHNF